MVVDKTINSRFSNNLYKSRSDRRKISNNLISPHNLLHAITHAGHFLQLFDIILQGAFALSFDHVSYVLNALVLSYDKYNI